MKNLSAGREKNAEFCGHEPVYAPGACTIAGNELFVDRRGKSITRATVNLAYQNARELEGRVSGPKLLGVFGASYLYPVFLRLGVITEAKAGREK